LNTTLTSHSMIHGDACFAYFNKIWGIPNCGGELVRRPVRPMEKLARFPASRKRKIQAHSGCEAAEGDCPSSN
jgi:hypothetical protein